MNKKIILAAILLIAPVSASAISLKMNSGICEYQMQIENNDGYLVQSRNCETSRADDVNNGSSLYRGNTTIIYGSNASDNDPVPSMQYVKIKGNGATGLYQPENYQNSSSICFVGTKNLGSGASNTIPTTDWYSSYEVNLVGSKFVAEYNLWCRIPEQ